MNLVFIGMPGTGKSTTSRKLAKEIGYRFIDTDYLVEKAAGMGLQEIINKYGESKFLDIEEQAILNLRLADYVISTGGSAVYSERAMKHLKINSWVIYLELAPMEIAKRLSMSYNMYNRGIVWLGAKKIKELYNMRLPLYQKYSDLTIDVLERTEEAVIKEILENFEI